MLDQRRQGIERLPHVGRRPCDEDPAPGLEAQHGSQPWLQRRHHGTEQGRIESSFNPNMRTTDDNRDISSRPLVVDHDLDEA
jgi:hypothetical protein